MAFSSRGAICISSSLEHRYTKTQRTINAFVALSPRLLSRFKQSPEIIKAESFTREGIALSDAEIAEQKTSMVEDALRQFHNPIASLEESRTEPMRYATVRSTPSGMETILGEEFDPLDEKLKEIDDISKQTKNVLERNNIGVSTLKTSIFKDHEPLKMAFRVERLVSLMDRFSFQDNDIEKMVGTLKQFASSHLIAEHASYKDTLQPKPKRSTKSCSTCFSKSCGSCGIGHSQVKTDQTTTLVKKLNNFQP